MTRYRYVTPTRSGKWYPSIEAAQKAANKIGAGFWDDANGAFYCYPQARLEAQPSALRFPQLAEFRPPGQAMPISEAA